MSDFITRLDANAQDVAAFKQLIQQFHVDWELALQGTAPPQINLFVARLPRLDLQDELRDQLVEIDNRYQQLLSNEARSARTNAPTETIEIDAESEPDCSAISIEANPSLAATIDPNARPIDA